MSSGEDEKVSTRACDTPMQKNTSMDWKEPKGHRSTKRVEGKKTEEEQGSVACGGNSGSPVSW